MSYGDPYYNSGGTVAPPNVVSIWPGANQPPPWKQPDHSERIADALERIAASLEQMHLSQEEREALKTMRAMRR